MTQSTQRDASRRIIRHRRPWALAPAPAAMLLAALIVCGGGCGDDAQHANPAPAPTPTAAVLDGVPTCAGANLAKCGTCSGTAPQYCCADNGKAVGDCCSDATCDYTQCYDAADPSQPSGACEMPTASPPTQLEIVNQSMSAVTVYINFYPSSQIVPSDWSSFCTEISATSCTFSLAGSASRMIPASSKYLNVNVAFAVDAYACPSQPGGTLAEVNINNPGFPDVVDISLVNGFNLPMKVVVDPFGAATTLGPVTSMDGNETAFGVYPYGCDVCVARCCPGCSFIGRSDSLSCDTSPSLDQCGMPGAPQCTGCTGTGADGCKAGTQSNPDVPCQYQGIFKKGDGGTVQVILLAG